MTLQNKLKAAIFLIGLIAADFIYAASSYSGKPDSLIIIEKFQDLEKLWLDQSNGHVQVFNFWATWCKPCVRELPILELYNQKNKERVSITLVSLDRLSDLDRLKTFLSKRETSTRLVLLADKESSDWIDKVHVEWSGAIPATLVVSNNRKILLEREFETYSELYEAIDDAIEKSKQ